MDGPVSKTAPKTGSKANAGAFKTGEDARRGHGLPGRSGRKPNWFAAECAKAAEDQVLPKCVKYLEEHELADDASAWKWAAEYVTNYGKGRPGQHLTLAEDPEAPISSPLAELTRALTRLATTSDAE